MGDEFTTLLEKYRNNPNDEMEGLFIYQQEPMQAQDFSQNQQILQGLLGGSNNLANNMVAQSQQQTAEAMNAKNAFLNQQENLAQQTQAQGAQLAEQERRKQQNSGGLLGKLAMSYITGGLNKAVGGALGKAVGGSAGDVYSGGWLV